MGIPLWDTIKGWILGTWEWIENPIDDLWDGFRAKILGNWSWLNIAPQYIIDRVTATWSWVNTIDDKIRDVVKVQYSWLDTIDDKIRDVAWNHVAAKLGDWLLDWLLLNLTVWARIGYRVLDKIWNMEWDDGKKEVKE